MIVVAGCVEEPVTIIYKISAGEHYSTPQLFTNLDTNPLVFYAKFDSSAIASSTDINKLYGFTDANSSVHENSARFGWRWHNEKLEIFSYVYCDGQRSFTKIGEATIGEWQRYKIAFSDNDYTFTFHETSITEKRCVSGRGIYTILQPYYGGNATAPHDIYIGIRETFQ